MSSEKATAEKGTAPECDPSAPFEMFDLLGPRIQHITPLSEDGEGYCLLKAHVPPGVFVPIHAHADRETFFILAGEIEGLLETEWHRFGSGEVFDVPGGVKHAFRNASTDGVSMLVVTTMALGRFFRSVGRPLSTVPPGPPSAEALQRFAQASLAQGHWLGSIEDNAAVGITLSFT
jgi:quercetin dioxygenase-like cupin family protein